MIFPKIIQDIIDSYSGCTHVQVVFEEYNSDLFIWTRFLNQKWTVEHHDTINHLHQCYFKGYVSVTKCQNYIQHWIQVLEKIHQQQKQYMYLSIKSSCLCVTFPKTTFQMSRDKFECRAKIRNQDASMAQKIDQIWNQRKSWLERDFIYARPFEISKDLLPGYIQNLFPEQARVIYSPSHKKLIDIIWSKTGHHLDQTRFILNQLEQAACYQKWI